MKIRFLGTRGYIDARTRRHLRHSSTLLIYRGKRVLIDCGLDWLGKIEQLNLDAIVITHAHPDHAWGLQEGAPCPVYATTESWQELGKFPISQKKILIPGRRKIICGITFEPCAVIHSIRAPAVGYRITAGRAKLFYVPDVVALVDREKALRGVQLYIGDGATIKRSMVRRKGDQLFGHTPISTQLGWCQKEGVPRALFTHCGTQIVAGTTRTVNARVKALGREHGVEADIAYDGMEIIV